MNIIDQVCTFDQSAAIYSEGVWIQNATYWWYQNKHTGENMVMSPDKYVYQPNNDLVKVFPAPNVFEFGVLLSKLRSIDIAWSSYFYEDEFYCDLDHDAWNGSYQGITEARARAEAYIWLLRKNYIIEKGIVLI